MIICIVGKSGSGKSMISRMLKEYSNKIVILDVDKISHKTLEIDEVKEKIKNYIGDVFDSNNNIDRKKLRKIVFNDIDKLNYINDLSWRYMEKIIDSYLNLNKDKIVIIDWLLTTKTKYFKMADFKIFVDSPFEVRIKRAMKRDNITEEEFIRRDLAAPILNKEDFDIIINNNDIDNLEKEVEKIYDKSIIHRKF